MWGEMMHQYGHWVTARADCVLETWDVAWDLCEEEAMRTIENVPGTLVGEIDYHTKTEIMRDDQCVTDDPFEPFWVVYFCWKITMKEDE